VHLGSRLVTSNGDGTSRSRRCRGRIGPLFWSWWSFLNALSHVLMHKEG
jgi:hypothetical protein